MLAMCVPCKVILFSLPTSGSDSFTGAVVDILGGQYGLT